MGSVSEPIRYPTFHGGQECVWVNFVRMTFSINTLFEKWDRSFTAGNFFFWRMIGIFVLFEPFPLLNYKELLLHTIFHEMCSPTYFQNCTQSQVRLDFMAISKGWGGGGGGGNCQLVQRNYILCKHGLYHLDIIDRHHSTIKRLVQLSVPFYLIVQYIRTQFFLSSILC